MVPYWRNQRWREEHSERVLCSEDFRAKEHLYYIWIYSFIKVQRRFNLESVLTVLLRIIPSYSV